MQPESLGVIGLGAMGGSLAWQAARHGVRRIVAWTPFPADATVAARAGAVTEIAHSPTHVVTRSDLVVIAAPPVATLNLLEDLAPVIRRRRTLVTDLTGVKRPVMDLIDRLDLRETFAGSHPLCGTERSGFAAARPDLYRRALVYVTPSSDGELAEREVRDFWTTVMEASPVLIDAVAHDHQLARTSHLPQVVSTLLAVALDREAPRGTSIGPGARDVTRLARSNPDLWRDIAMLNREELNTALSAFQDALLQFRTALDRGDPEALHEMFALGRAFGPEGRE